MTSSVLTVRIPNQIKTNLEELGKSMNRSKSYIAEQAITEYLQRNSWQIQELKAAEQEIQQEVFISDEKVNNYLSSWGEAEEKQAPTS